MMNNEFERELEQQFEQLNELFKVAELPRGRPTGRGRVPLNHAQRKEQNANLECMRRQRLSLAQTILRKLTGLPEKANLATIIKGGIKKIHKVSSEEQQLENRKKQLERDNQKLRSEFLQLTVSMPPPVVEPMDVFDGPSTSDEDSGVSTGSASPESSQDSDEPCTSQNEFMELSPEPLDNEPVKPCSYDAEMVKLMLEMRPEIGIDSVKPCKTREDILKMLLDTSPVPQSSNTRTNTSHKDVTYMWNGLSQSSSHASPDVVPRALSPELPSLVTGHGVQPTIDNVAWENFDLSLLM